MANCVNYDCEDTLPDHTLNTCGDELLGGVKDAILLECDSQITDPSNATQVQAELDAGRATLVKNVSIELPAATPTLVDSTVACSTQKVARYERTLNLIDGNVSDANVDFYNEVFSTRSFGGIILHECGEDEVTWIDEEIRFTGSRIIPNNNNEFQTFTGVGTWQTNPDRVDGNIYETPAGIFD